jgi:hypothetical protein
MNIFALLNGISLWCLFAQSSEALAARIRTASDTRKTGSICNKHDNMANGVGPKRLFFDFIAFSSFLVENF